MDRDLLDRLVREFLALYAAKDLESISKMFSEHVVLRDWNYEVVGKVAAVKEFKKNFEEAGRLSIDIKNIYFSEQAAAAEIEVAVNDSVLGIVDVISFDENGLIRSINAYRAF